MKGLVIFFFFKIFRRPDNFSRLCDTWWLIRKSNESDILSEPSLQRMGWPTHHLVSLECHRGPIHMTFRSGHGTHFRLISSLERWGSCQGSLQRMGWPTHHLVSLECHRGPIHMTFRSGHGKHLRLISTLERWSCCHGNFFVNICPI